MNCPLETPETASILLDYCSRTLTGDAAGILEKHLELCPSCRQFAENQKAVWSALDAWEHPEVSPGFDQALYRRISEVAGWRDQLASVLRPLTAYRGVPAAAAACLLLLATVLIVSPNKPQASPPPPDVALVDVQPEQVEKALDAMEVLSEFNRKVRPEKADSKL